MALGRFFRVSWHALHDVFFFFFSSVPFPSCLLSSGTIDRSTPLLTLRLAGYGGCLSIGDTVTWLASSCYMLFFFLTNPGKIPLEMFTCVCVCHLLLLSEIFGWLVWGRGCHCITVVNSMGEGVLWGWVNQYQCCLWMRCGVTHYPWILIIDINMSGVGGGGVGLLIISVISGCTIVGVEWGGVGLH